MFTVISAPASDPRATALLDASQGLMQALFPPEENHFLSHEELMRPDIRFFVAAEGEDYLGCGALKVMNGYGEVKSFYTAEDARGRGVGHAILAALEARARAEGLPLLRLETADTLAAACRLYEGQGFIRRGPFGAYEENGSSVFMEKPLIP